MPQGPEGLSTFKPKAGTGLASFKPTATAAETGRLALRETTISPPRSFLERTVGAVPEMVGTTVGGILGAGAGGPAGAAAGGGIGAAGGESLRQLLAATGISPRTFGTLESAEPERITKAAAFGAATEGIGGKIAQTLPGFFKRKLTPEQVSDISLLEREGIPFSAGDIRPEGMMQQLENLARGTLLGGKPASRFEQTQRAGIEQFQEKVLDRLGPLLSKEEAGQAIQSAVAGRHQQLIGRGGVFERAYRRVSALFPVEVNTESIRKQVAPIKAELDKLTAEGRIGAAAKSKESPSRFLDLVDRLANYGTKEAPPQPASAILDASGQPVRAAQAASRQEIPLTYADVWKDKQSLDAVIRSMGADDPLRTRAKGMLKQLHGILDDAMEQAAQKVSPQAAQRIRNINKAYAETKELFETEAPVAKIGEAIPEKVIGRIFAPGAVSNPKRLLTALNENPELKPVLKRQLGESLFEGIGKEVEGITVTPVNALRGRFLKAKPTLETIWSKEDLKGFEEFLNAAARTQASGRMTNPASGRQLLAMSQASSGTMAVWYTLRGSFGLALPLAGYVVAPAVAAKALFNPRVAKLLATGFEIKPGTAEALRWTGRAVNALRAVESQPEKQPRE